MQLRQCVTCSHFGRNPFFCFYSKLREGACITVTPLASQSGFPPSGPFLGIDRARSGNHRKTLQNHAKSFSYSIMFWGKSIFTVSEGFGTASVLGMIFRLIWLLGEGSLCKHSTSSHPLHPPTHLTTHLPTPTHPLLL